jgi:hypothetical protein
MAGRGGWMDWGSGFLSRPGLRWWISPPVPVACGLGEILNGDGKRACAVRGLCTWREREEDGGVRA